MRSRSGDEAIPESSSPPAPTAGQCVVYAALAGGLGWGIRGQYGHETGAMIAGLLVGLVIVTLLCPRWKSLSACRAVAWCTVAMGFGGSMTYGQIVGLTHDPALVGNWAALRWGMLGLAVVGALWIGFAGAFLGMSLGGCRYGRLELVALFAGMLALFCSGVLVLNEPFRPAEKVLPWLYFSADWRWQPDADLKPRREVWGGFLIALAGLATYLRFGRRDFVACRLLGWGLLGGAVGFPLGQSLQAFHAWNASLFQTGIWSRIDSVVNWWNFMESVFGATMGAFLGWGAWRSRQSIQEPDNLTTHGKSTLPADVMGCVWLSVHAALVAGAEFTSDSFLGAYAEVGIVMGVLPLIAVSSGRWAAYGMVLPVTLLPIAGKTVRRLIYELQSLPESLGWFVYFILPLGLATALAVWLARSALAAPARRLFSVPTLLFAVWIYFVLNFAVFEFPWPFSAWTRRTPNGLVFLAAAIGLSWMAWAAMKTQRQGRADASSP